MIFCLFFVCFSFFPFLSFFLIFSFSTFFFDFCDLFFSLVFFFFSKNVFGFLFLRRTSPPPEPLPGPPSAGPPSAGPPKISLFFPLPAHIFALFSLSLSLEVFSLNFGGVLKGGETQTCTFGLSACRVKPRRPFPSIAHTHRKKPSLPIRTVTILVASVSSKCLCMTFTGCRQGGL